jgi:hypothetical protein
MPNPDGQERRSQIKVLLATSAAGMVVGFGMCGLAATSGSSRAAEPFIPIGAFLFLLSFATFAVSLLVAIFRWFIKLPKK